MFRTVSASRKVYNQVIVSKATRKPNILSPPSWSISHLQQSTWRHGTDSWAATYRNPIGSRKGKKQKNEGDPKILCLSRRGSAAPTGWLGCNSTNLKVSSHLQSKRWQGSSIKLSTAWARENCRYEVSSCNLCSVSWNQSPSNSYNGKVEIMNSLVSSLLHATTAP